MPIHLKRAQLSDAEALHRMQVTAFLPLLNKYHDTAINPACETVERVREKIATSPYYFIMADGVAVGGIRIKPKSDPQGHKSISPLFILPKYQGKGIAQRAILEAERLHGGHHWRLDTILEEPGNCHLYEKLGYHRVGAGERVRPNMTIVDYEKE